MTQEMFNKCIKVLKKSKSDNDTLAALLMVTKVVKDDSSVQNDLETMKKIFQAVGIDFFRRMLKTGSTAEDCSNISIKSVAVSILSCLCAVPGFVQACDPGLFHILPHLTEVIKVKDVSSEEEEDTTQLVSDCYDCLKSVVSYQNGRDSFVLTGCPSSLCQAVCEESIGHARSLELLLYISEMSSSQLWEKSMDDMVKLIEKLSKNLQDEESVVKFELCSNLATLLMSANKAGVEVIGATGTPSLLHTVLFHLLQNKLGQEQRMNVVRLSSVMVAQFGVPWTLVNQGVSNPKFLLLMVHLACIEIRMTLESEHLEKISHCGSLLGTCYGLVEHVIEHLSAGPSLQLEDKQVAQLHSAMVGAFNAIIQFLDRVSSETTPETLKPIIVASVRALGSWIAEETTALREEVLSLLPFLIDMSRETFEKAQGSSGDKNGSVCDAAAGQTVPEEIIDPNTSKKSTTETFTENGESESKSEPRTVLCKETNQALDSVELLQFLMPGLCHLSAEDSARKILLTSDLPQLLCDYLVYQWKRLKDAAQVLHYEKEPAVAMTTTCGVLLNIIVLEGHLVTTNPIFKELFAFVAGTLETLIDSKNDLVTLEFNLLLIGLMIVRRHTGAKDMSQGALDNFFRDGIKLFQCAHFSSPEGNDDGKSGLAYHSQWQDFSELWGLGIQVLCECLHYFIWLPKTVLATKWLPKACKMLLDAEGDTVPQDIAIAYESLFLALANSNPICCEVLKDAGVLNVARKYKTSLTAQIKAVII